MYGTSSTFQSSSGIIYKLKLVFFFTGPTLMAVLNIWVTHNLAKAYENASRQAKLRAEIAQATRENKTYIRNVERAKMVEKMESSKKRKLKELAGASDGTDSEELEPLQLRRQFRQPSTAERRTEEGEC